MRNKKNSFLVILLVTILGIFSGCTDNKGAATVESVIDKMIVEYGGAENLKKLNSYKTVWDMNAVSKNEKGTDTRYIEIPDKLRVEIVYEKSAEVRILNGEKGIRAFMEPEKDPVSSWAEGPPLLAMQMQFMRFFSPLVLQKKKALLTLTEDKGFNVLTLTEGPIAGNYYINPETNRIEKFVGKFSMQGRAMEFLTEYSNFEIFQGVLIHKNEVKYAAGVNTAVLGLKWIGVGATLEEKVFKLE
ncbi:MAG: hypothetical protein KAT46_00535 [Deltaproteobacteria bacterium]|nr:hypothetical protein [Deltaproteobacteria bacterium]